MRTTDGCIHVTVTGITDCGIVALKVKMPDGSEVSSEAKLYEATTLSSPDGEISVCVAHGLYADQAKLAVVAPLSVRFDK